MNQYTIISKYGKRTHQHKFKIIREEQWQPANRFAPDLNEREVIELEAKRNTREHEASYKVWRENISR